MQISSIDAQNLRLMAFDVDGVMTDGGIILIGGDSEAKRFDVQDGMGVGNRWKIPTVLDNLIHRLAIPDMVVCFSDSPDRLKEYASDEAHARFLKEELVPHLERTLISLACSAQLLSLTGQVVNRA